MTKVITLNKNMGPAIARNIGIKKSRGEIVIGIDSDVSFVNENVLKNVADQLTKTNNCDCIAFRILDHNTMNDDKERWWHPVPIEIYGNRKFYTYYLSGTGFAARKEVLLKSGLFPEDLFMFNEEVELALRILDSGFQILYCPEIIVIHRISKIARVNKITYYYKRRNQLWMVVKYYPIITGFLFIFPRIIKSIFNSILDGNFILFLKCMYDGFKQVPYVIKKRKPLKKKTWVRIQKLNKGELLFGK